MGTLTREQVTAAVQLTKAWSQGNGLAFEVPNMDAIDESELLALQRVFGLLEDYAQVKRSAMLHRTRGDIQQSTEHERQCETLYGLLPVWAKW